MFKYTRKEH